MAKFEKGQSGNPKGWPLGSGLRADAAWALFNQKSRSDGAARERGGALKICLDRLLPSLKSKALPVTLEGIGGTFAEQGGTKRLRSCRR